MEHVTRPRRDRHSCTEAAGEGGECAGTRPAAQPQRDGAPHPCGPALSEVGGAPVRGGRSPPSEMDGVPVRGGWSPPSEMDRAPHQRWTESPSEVDGASVRDGQSPPSEADGAPCPCGPALATASCAARPVPRAVPLMAARLRGGQILTRPGDEPRCSRAAPVGCRRAGLPAVGLDSHTWAAHRSPGDSGLPAPGLGVPPSYVEHWFLTRLPCGLRGLAGRGARRRVGGWRPGQLRPQEDLPPAAGIKGQLWGKNLLGRRLVPGGKRRGDAHGRATETDRS